MKQISTVKPEFWVGLVDDEIIQDARGAGLSETGIEAMVSGDKRTYKRELDALSTRNPGSIWACTTGYSLWFNSAGEREKEADYKKLNTGLAELAEAELKKDRDKYALLIDKGAPAVIARKARYWSPQRIKAELGVEIDDLPY